MTILCVLIGHDWYGGEGHVWIKKGGDYRMFKRPCCGRCGKEGS